MKFKVGDTVGCVYDDSGSIKYIGAVGRITEVRISNPYPYEIDFAPRVYFKAEELALVSESWHGTWGNGFFISPDVEMEVKQEGYINQIEQDLLKLK